MSNMLSIYASIFIFLVIFLILYYIKKGKINIKYSVIWLCLFSILFIFLIVPGFLTFMTKLLGFNLSSNMIFSLLIGTLIIINIFLTVIVSSLFDKIRILTQEVSILKSMREKND